MANSTKSIFVVTAVLASSIALAGGCSSSDSAAAPGTDGGKDSKVATKPTAKPQPAPVAPKPTSKPSAKPTASTTAPPTPPPTSGFTAKPLLDPAQLSADEAFELDATCPAGLEEGKGFCFESSDPSSDYLDGCVGGKYKAMNCDHFNSADQVAFCDDSDKAGCYGIALTSVSAGEIENAKTAGKPIEDGECKAVQDGKGFCLDTGFYVCSGGKVYSLDCAAAYGAPYTCRAPSFDPANIGCWSPTD